MWYDAIQKIRRKTLYGSDYMNECMSIKKGIRSWNYTIELRHLPCI